jgi:hypothetical protein
MWFLLLNFNILFSLFAKLQLFLSPKVHSTTRILTTCRRPAGGERLPSLAFLVKSILVHRTTALSNDKR